MPIIGERRQLRRAIGLDTEASFTGPCYATLPLENSTRPPNIYGRYNIGAPTSVADQAPPPPPYKVDAGRRVATPLAKLRIKRLPTLTTEEKGAAHPCLTPTRAGEQNRLLSPSQKPLLL
eukprot:4426110-Pyramimonas_sp.AAC.3